MKQTEKEQEIEKLLYNLRNLKDKNAELEDRIIPILYLAHKSSKLITKITSKITLRKRWKIIINIQINQGTK